MPRLKRGIISNIQNSNLWCPDKRVRKSRLHCSVKRVSGCCVTSIVRYVMTSHNGLFLVMYSIRSTKGEGATYPNGESAVQVINFHKQSYTGCSLLTCVVFRSPANLSALPILPFEIRMHMFTKNCHRNVVSSIVIKYCFCSSDKAYNTAV